MSYSGANDIRVDLRTQDGRQRWFWLSRSEEGAWDRDGEDQTTQAVFTQHGADGEEVATYRATGDEWRAMESGGMVDAVAYWCRRGVPLQKAIAACIQGVDPDGKDSTYEQQIDVLQERIASLEGGLQRAYNVLKETAINEQLYAMKITNPQHPWHEDVMEIERVMGIARAASLSQAEAVPK